MNILSKGEHSPITHIIHIADIHVRVGNKVASRVDEYTHVFENFCTAMAGINAVSDGTALLVIAGDVFHNKGRMDAVAGHSFFLWINKLLNMMPIVVICGNHDYRQEDVTFTDMVELFTAPYTGRSHKYDIHYLRDTGLYVYENIGFGVTSIKETLRSHNTCGIVDELSSFPHGITLSDVECKVALFHGTITQSSLPSGRNADSVTHGYPLEWFQGYDILMLGDNHKQQMHSYKSMHWGYPGSLIQQDFGEPTFGHGYILWDVADRTGTMHHIPNMYGAFTISKASEGKYMASLTPKSYIELSDVVKYPRIPHHPKIRVVGSYEDVQNISNFLVQHGITPVATSLSKEIASVNTNVSDTSSLNALSELNKTYQWEEYISRIDSTLDVHEWIINPSSMMLPAYNNASNHINGCVQTRNNKIRPFIDAYDAELQKVNTCTYNIALVYMEWQYLMCYAKNNYFSFEDINGKIALLNGANATGKSAFMDVLSIALFGEPTSSRREYAGNTMTSKIIYDGKPHGDSSYVILHIDVNGTRYEIYRTFAYQSETAGIKDNDTIQNRIAAIYKIVDNEKCMVAEGSIMVSDWIKRHIGTSEEMQMSTVVCQHDNFNFFFQKTADQRLILERALHIETITAYERIIDESLKAHKYVLGEVTSYHKGVVCDLPADIEVDAADCNELDSKLSITRSKIDALVQRSNVLLGAVGNIDDLCTQYDTQSDIETELADATLSRSLLGEVSDTEKNGILKLQGSLEHRQKEIVENADKHGFKITDITLAQAIETHNIHCSRVQNHELCKPSYPLMTVAQIHDIESKYTEWKSNQPADLIDKKPDKINKTVEKLKTELNKTNKSIAKLDEKRVVRPSTLDIDHDVNSDIESLYNTYDAMRVQHSKHIEYVPACGRQLASCDNAIQLYHKWLSTQPVEYVQDPNAAEESARKFTRIIENSESLLLELKSLHVPYASAVVDVADDDIPVDIMSIKQAIREHDDNAMEIEAKSTTVSLCRPASDQTALNAWNRRLSEWMETEKLIRNSNLTDLELRRGEIVTFKDSLESKNGELDALRKIIAANDAEIADISQIEFNPECAACCKQPKCIRLNALKQEQTKLSKKAERIRRQVAKMIKAAKGNTYDEELAHIAHMMSLHNEYDKELPHMTLEISAWEQAAREHGVECERLKALSILKDANTRLANKIRIAWNRDVDKAQTDMNDAKPLLKIASNFCKQYAMQQSMFNDAVSDREKALVFQQWNNELENIQSAVKKAHTNLWINWEREYTYLIDRKAVLVNEIEAKEEFLKSLQYWTSEMAIIQEQKQNVLQWDAWTKEYDTIAEERDYAAWNIQRMELEADMHNNKHQIEMMDKRAAIDANIAILNRMLAYRDWKIHNDEISLLRREETELLEQLARDRYMRDGLTTKIEEHRNVLAVINDVQSRLNKLQEFHRRFIGNKQDEGFKSYIYKEKVLPLIETEVNQFISTIDAFRLKIRVKNSKFIFMLEDRGNTPTLDHASGYQKFVVGLAMRVALSRIGAVGQNLRHLFLDEGFTACDSINIQKTGELLKDIMFMAGYQSMIIMSHLDTIRDASDLQIQIQRNSDGRSSRIQLGIKRDPMPKGARQLSLTDAPVKKRGRPRKNA